MRDSKRETDIKNRLLDSVEEREGGMIWEKNIETSILPYVKYISSPGPMHETGYSRPVLWDDPEGWDGERGEWIGQMGGRWQWWMRTWIWVVQSRSLGPVTFREAGSTTSSALDSLNYKKRHEGPGGPVIKTAYFEHKWHGFDPSSGN